MNLLALIFIGYQFYARGWRGGLKAIAIVAVIWAVYFLIIYTALNQ